MNVKLQLYSWIIVFFISFLLSNQVLSQDSAKVVILSDRVGETIDKIEREKFHLFHSIDNFERATFYLLPDSSFEAHITRTSNIASSDTVVHYSFSAVMMLAEKIIYFEQIDNGMHRMGDATISVRTIDGKIISRNLPYWKGIPIAHSKLSIFPYRPIDSGWGYPIFRFTFGFSTYNPDLSGLDATFRAIEDRYKQQGYSIYSRASGFETSPLLWVSFTARTSQSLGFLIDAGTSISQLSQTHGFLSGGVTTSANELEFHSASIAVLYYYPITDLNELQPYIGAGINHIWFSADKLNIGESSTTYLRSIYVKGSSYGGTIYFGVDIIPHPSVVINAFANYLIIPELTSQINEGTTAVARMSSLIAGMKIGFSF